MPHFYFNIRKVETTVLDPEGVDLPDLPAAREEAVATIRELKFGPDSPGRHGGSVGHRGVQ